MVQCIHAILKITLFFYVWILEIRATKYETCTCISIFLSHGQSIGKSVKLDSAVFLAWSLEILLFSGYTSGNLTDLHCFAFKVKWVCAILSSTQSHHLLFYTKHDRQLQQSYNLRIPLTVMCSWRSSVIGVYVIYHSTCIYWPHYSMVKLYGSNFLIITPFLRCLNFSHFYCTCRNRMIWR